MDLFRSSSVGLCRVSLPGYPQTSPKHQTGVSRGSPVQRADTTRIGVTARPKGAARLHLMHTDLHPGGEQPECHEKFCLWHHNKRRSVKVSEESVAKQTSARASSAVCAVLTYTLSKHHASAPVSASAKHPMTHWVPPPKIPEFSSSDSYDHDTGFAWWENGLAYRHEV